MHLILLRHAPPHQMQAPLRILLAHQLIRRLRPLRALEDEEVIVGGMPPRVTLGAERRAEDDDVLGDARVDQVHAAHAAARVVEHPFARERRDLLRAQRLARQRRGGGGGRRRVRGERVRCHVRSVGFLEAADDVVHDAGGRVGVEGERVIDEGLEGLGVEDVPSVL